MKLRLSLVALLALACSLFAAEDPGLPPAAPPYYRVQYQPSTQPGELVFGVSYTIWIPPGVKTLRGVIVHQHGCGEGACKAGRTAAFDLHWQELARRHDCALLGPSYEQPEKANCTLWCDPRYGSEQKFLQALDELGQASGHPELSKVPWALWGHSGGATWSGIMLLRHADRITGVWLRSGWPHGNPNAEPKQPDLEIPEEALHVPVIFNFGAKEKTSDRFKGVWTGGLPYFLDLRARGALACLAPDPNTMHECGDSRYLAIPFLDACLTARLPKGGGALRPMPLEKAWLSPVEGDTASPAAAYTGDAKQANWLPNEAIAKAWIEYVKTGATTDTTPPPAPTNLRLTDGKLAWSARADFESGLGGFIIERDGKELARLPEKPQSRFGRPLFQRNSYSDTPEQPLAVMEYSDTTAQPTENHTYRVRAVNSVGLISEPSAAVSAGPAKSAAGDDPLTPWRSGVSIHPVAPGLERHSIHSYFNTCPESPDGRWVLFFTSIATDGQSGEVRIRDRVTGEERVLARDLQVEDAHRAACQQWVSGGKRVVFHGERGDSWFVAAVDLADGKERVLARDRLSSWGQPTSDLVPIYGLHWNPHASRDFELANAATGEIQTALKAEAVKAAFSEWWAQSFGDQPASIFFPVLSPDLSRVFFKMAAPGNGNPRSQGASARQGLICYSLAEKRFLMMRTKWGHPAWAPDSRHIVEVGYELIDSNNGKTERLEGLPPMGSGHPSSSPDGKLLVTDLVSDPKTGEWSVVVADARGNDSVVLDQFNNSHGARSWRVSHPHPVFSGDGHRIYFNVSSGPWTELYVAEAGPGQARR